MHLPANYLPVRVTSFAVILARLSASLHEIAHTRAILSTYYGKKTRNKIRYFKYSTFEKPIPRRSEKYNKFGGFQRNVTQEEIVLTRNCFFILSYGKRNLHTAAYYIPKLVRAL